MFTLSNWLKFSTVRQIFSEPVFITNYLSSRVKRNYADKAKTDVNRAKTIQIQGTENEERVRVRRARPADVPRVLRFVREQSRSTWPGLITTPSASHLVLCDYVARALAQGHSMLAEQQENRRGWSKIRGFALGMAVCPWDAKMLERWARCIRCERSRRLLHFTAHCLNAPALHDKYKVYNILQVIMIVPQDSPKSPEIAKILAKNVIQRGQETGFPILRFDVTNDVVASVLEGLKLKKECQVTYNSLPDTLKHQNTRADISQPIPVAKTSKYEVIEQVPKSLPEENYVTVYTAITGKNI